MPRDPTKLQSIASAAIRLAKDAERNPLKYWRPTPVQKRVVQDYFAIILLRGGNQIGKTMVGCFEVHCRCIGWHPYKKVKPPPIEVWIIVHSWEQSKVIQKKFWDMAPKSELHPDTEYIPGKGFKGKYPTVRYKNGSIVYFKTTGQGTLGVASGTVDFVWVDEPPPPDIWGELKARTTRTRGEMLLTLTPIGAPVDYLKEMVKDGIISEHVGVMSVENCTPEGCKSMMTQEEIDALARSYLSIDREARMSGDWDGGVPEGRIFDAFTEEMISDEEPTSTYYDDRGLEKDKDFIFAVGIDHGHDVASQVAILSCIDMTDPQDPHIYIIDEYVADGAGAQKHARGILAMLKRNDLEIADITRWTGDRRHGGSKKGDGKMSNSMLMAGFAHELKYPKNNLPFKIRTAFKPRWSVIYGCSVIHERMVLGKFQIFPCCEKTIKSLKLWAMKKNGQWDTMSEHKHCIDGMRYGVMPIVDVKYRKVTTNKIRQRR
jgi:phage terminase large subunit-like protein